MTAFLSNALKSTHRVSVVSLHLEKETMFFQLNKQVIHHVLPPYNGKLGILQQIRSIHKFVKKDAIDCLINVDVGIGFYGILAAKDTSAKVITWEHGNYFNNWGSKLFPYLRRYAARKSDAMVVLTERDRRNYESNIQKCAPVTAIANPAEKRAYNYDSASKTILSAGLLGKIKRFELTVPIGKTVFAKHPDWKWVLCGDGPERENLENAVREAGLAQNILFRGSVSDMDAQYAGAAMYVLTSEMEGLPMVLLEAKAHGLPIVSFDIETGPSDIIRDGVNGWLVESGNTEEMAAKICELIEDAALRKQFSESAALDMDKFDGETIVKQWETLIESLVI